MGSTQQDSSGHSNTKTEPWNPTIDPLKQVINKIEGQIPGYKTTGNENAAFDELTANARAGNPYTGSMDEMAKYMLSGGHGSMQGAYDQFKHTLDPYASGDMINNNVGLKAQLDTNANDISSRVNGMFAAGGRDFSGANLNSLARGITEGNAPIIANQYNTDVQRQIDAATGIYNGANTTAQGIAGLGQAGVDMGNKALEARDSGANRMLQIEAQRRNLPVQNLGNLTGLLTPLAQLGGKSQTNTQQSTTTTPPLGMQIVQGASSLMGAASGMKAPGAGWGGGKA